MIRDVYNTLVRVARHGIKIKDGTKEHAKWTITKYANEEDWKLGKIMDVSNFEPNQLMNVGINNLTTILCSAGGTKYDNTNAKIGVGDSSTAEVASQTNLQAATNKLFKAMDSGFPTYGTSQKAIWQSTFTGTEANWAWNEFCVTNGADGVGTLLNRKVSSQGTKTAGQVWVVSIEITWS